MSLTAADLEAIKKLFDQSFDERVPRIIDERVPSIIDSRVQPMLDRLEKRLTRKLDGLTLQVGQFSLETTRNFINLNNKVDDLDDKLVAVAELADANGVETRKIKRKLGWT